MSLLFKAPRTSQPQGAVEVDFSHPLATGLLFIQVGDRMVDVLNPAHASTFRSASPGSAGQATKYTGTKAVWTSPKAPSRWLGALSVGSVFQPATLSVDMALIGYGYSNGGTNTPIEFGTASTAGAIKFGRAAAAGYKVWSSPNSVVQAGKTSVVMGTQAAGIQNTPSFYVGGSKTGTATAIYSGSGTGNATVTGSVFNTGGRNDASSLLQGSTFLLAVWDRQLSDSEATSWTTNPWQLFKPQSRSLWIPGTVSAGGDLTITATPGTATASGQTATVNLQTAITATLATAAASGNTANIDLGSTFAAGQAIADASGYSAIIKTGAVVTGSVGGADAVGFDAGISLDVAIAASYGIASADGYQAQVSLQRAIADEGGGAFKKSSKRHGWGAERARLEQSLIGAPEKEQIEVIAKTMGSSGVPKAKRIARKLEDYTREIKQAESLQREIKKLEVELVSRKMQEEIRKDLQLAATELKEILQDDEDFSNLIPMLHAQEMKIMRGILGV